MASMTEHVSASILHQAGVRGAGPRRSRPRGCTASHGRMGPKVPQRCTSQPAPRAPVPCQNPHEGLTLGFALGAHARPPCLPAHHPALRLAGAASPERHRLKSDNLTHPPPFRWRLRGRTTGSTWQRSGRGCATPGPASVKAQATPARPWRSSVSTRRRRLGRVTCACRKPRPRYATRRYSLIRPPNSSLFLDAVVVEIDRFG